MENPFSITGFAADILIGFAIGVGFAVANAVLGLLSSGRVGK